MFEGITINEIMRQIVTALDMPVKIILIILLVISLIMLGGLIAEFFHRKYLTVKAASVIDAIKDRVLISQEEHFYNIR